MILISLLSDLRILVGGVLLFLWLAWRSNASQDSRTRVGFNLLVISILLLPIFNGIYFLSISTPLGKSDALMQWLIFSLVLFEILLRGRKKITYDKKNRFLMAAIAFWIMGFLSAVYNHLAIRPNIFYAPIALILFIILAPDRESLRDIYKISCFALFVNLILYILNFNFQPNQNTAVVGLTVSSQSVPYENPLWGLTGNLERYQGPFTHPNGFGTYLGIMIVLLFASQEKFTRPFVLIGWFLLLLTSSRGSILSTLISSLVIVTVWLKCKVGKKKVVSKNQLVILMSFLTVTFRLFFNSGDKTLTGRTYIWRSYLEVWKSSPIIGVGVQLKSVESAYIWTLVAMGVLGLICLISIFFLIFISIPRELTPDNVLIFALLTYIIFRCSTDASYLFYTWDAATLSILSISVFSRTKAGSSQNSLESKPKSPK
jgi:hypothetical protein